MSRREALAEPGAASEGEISQYEFLVFLPAGGLSRPHPLPPPLPPPPPGLQVLKRRGGVPPPSSWVWGLCLPASSLAQAPL